jgi:hypothetical protein
MAGPWEKYQQQPAAASSQGFPGVIQGPPATANPIEQQRLGISEAQLGLARNQDAREQQKLQLEQDKANLAKQKADNLKSDTVDSVKSVLDQIDSVESDVKDGWFNGLGETGMSGWMMRSFPGSAAYDLQRKIDMIDANTAFDRLQQMRQNSPTGGAVGNVSDNDLRLLKSTIASLDPNQSQESFLAALHKARKTYQATLAKLTGQPASVPAKTAPAHSNSGWKIEQVGN